MRLCLLTDVHLLVHVLVNAHHEYTEEVVLFYSSPKPFLPCRPACSPRVTRQLANWAVVLLLNVSQSQA